MEKVIYKKDKKYLIIDGREYGPKSLYFHIKRTISILESFTESGYWDENRQKEVRQDIQRLINIFYKHYTDGDVSWLLRWYIKNRVSPPNLPD